MENQDLLLIKKKLNELANLSSWLEHIEEQLIAYNDLLLTLSKQINNDEVIGTKKEAAQFIGRDEQTISNLLSEGRIINYGRGRLFIFHKSELMDVRERRNGNN